MRLNKLSPRAAIPRSRHGSHCAIRIYKIMKAIGSALLLVVVLLGVALKVQAAPLPQDMQDIGMGMLMVAAQIKEVVESGAAARNEHSVEIFGQKMSNNMALGFGDAMRPIGRRRRRQV